MRLLKPTVFVVLVLVAITAATLAPLPTQAQDGTELTEFVSGNVRFVYPTELATSITETPIEAVPYDGTTMPLWAANPAYSQYIFEEYPAPEGTYYTPVISLYPTADFETYTEREGDFPWGYGIELDALNALLEEQPDLTPYTELATAGMPDSLELPYLPVANAAQVFRTQAEFIPFDDGWGVRYITYYSQAVNPLRDQDLFYTFQGISNDGSTYVSVQFPILSGLLPTTYPEDFDYEAFANDYMNFLNETVAALNAQDGELFTPTLSTLDSIVLSLSINGTIDYVPLPEATEEASGG
ncbi:MAG: hypothetical protein K8L91_26565 [Anaerolineae bacterium]|nr:hypothetical protein [Anaerolineae bacterium]